MEILKTTLGEFAVGRFIGEHFRKRMCWRMEYTVERLCWTIHGFIFLLPHPSFGYDTHDGL